MSRRLELIENGALGSLITVAAPSQIGDGISNRRELGNFYLDFGDVRKRQALHVLAGSMWNTVEREQLAHRRASISATLAIVRFIRSLNRTGSAAPLVQAQNISTAHYIGSEACENRSRHRSINCTRISCNDHTPMRAGLTILAAVGAAA